MNPFVLVLAAALAVVPSALAAQDSAPVAPNDRLRFTAPAAGYANRVAGTVVEVREGDLHVTLGRANDPAAILVVVPVESLTTLERSEGTASRVRMGTYGAVAGAGFGALAGVLQLRLQTSDVDNQGRPVHRESHVAEITVAGAAIGAFVGALLPGERWRPLGVPASLSTSGAGAGRPALGFRLGL